MTEFLSPYAERLSPAEQVLLGHLMDKVAASDDPDGRLSILELRRLSAEFRYPEGRMAALHFLARNGVRELIEEAQPYISFEQGDNDE